MSLLSALAMALAAWFVCRIVLEETNDAPASLCSAWLFAAGLVAWSHATRAEVHALETACFAAILYYLLRWYRTVRDDALYKAAGAFGLAVAVHPIALFALPGILACVVARLDVSAARSLRRAFGVALLTAAPWFLYIPLRSAYITAHHLDPVSALGIVGSAFWDYGHPAIVQNLVALVTGRDADASTALHGYASESFLDGAVSFLAVAMRELTLVGSALALLGIVVAARRDVAQTLIIVGCAAFSAAFAFGFTSESDISRYFLPTFVVLAVFAGMAIAALRAAPLRMVALSNALLAVVWLVATQRWLFNQPHDDRARLEVNEVLANTPHNAILVADWVLAPALAYTGYVEHATGGRILVPAWYGDVDEYLPQWVARAPVYVVGTPQGSVKGFRLERTPAHTQLYHVVPE
jgi:hypothetical protein